MLHEILLSILQIKCSMRKWKILIRSGLVDGGWWMEDDGWQLGVNRWWLVGRLLSHCRPFLVIGRMLGPGPRFDSNRLGSSCGPAP